MSEGEDEQRDPEPSAGNERVGYGRPPLGTRFRPGQSGNSNGRPQGARNLSTIVAAALSERVTINENGRRRRITKLEAAVKQLVNRAATGEARATQLLLALVQANEARPVQQDAHRLKDADAIVMAELARRLGGR
jgi:Family of unknown function (DUF5681)